MLPRTAAIEAAARYLAETSGDEANAIRINTTVAYVVGDVLVAP